MAHTQPPVTSDSFIYNKKMEEVIQEKQRQDYLRSLVAAMNTNIASDVERSLRSNSLEDLKTIIDRKIKEHEKMIATLQWFSAHIKLDDPNVDNLFVGRIIMAGMESLYQEKQLR
jgi:hypothetical protein